MNNPKHTAEKILNCKTYDIPDIQELASAYLELEKDYRTLDQDHSKIKRNESCLQESFDYQKEEITKLKKSRGVLRKAVEFYGDLQNHRMIHDSGDGFVNTSNIDLDVGRKASEAIKEDDEIMGGE